MIDKYEKSSHKLSSISLILPESSSISLNPYFLIPWQRFSFIQHFHLFLSSQHIIHNFDQIIHIKKFIYNNYSISIRVIWHLIIVRNSTLILIWSLINQLIFWMLLMARVFNVFLKKYQMNDIMHLKIHKVILLY